MTTMTQLFGLLKTNGGCIVSSGDCGKMAITHAQARGDFTVDAEGFGYVLRPHAWLKKHSRFASGATDSCEQQVDDLAMLARRLVRELRKASPENILASLCVDYLVKNGMSGDVMRYFGHNNGLSGGEPKAKPSRLNP